MAKASRAGKRSRRAEFPARDPELQLLQAPSFDPEAGAAAAIGCVVTIRRDGVAPTERHVVTAVGAYRLRVLREGQPRTSSYVIPRGEISGIISRPERKRRGGSRRPRALRIAGDAPVGAIAEALVRWADDLKAGERVTAALREAIQRLEA